MKTRTAVIYAPGEPIRVEEIELDPPKDHEVLVRMVAAGICHSDYHIISGELPIYPWRSATKEQASLKRSAPTSQTASRETTLSSASFPPADIVATASQDIPTFVTWGQIF